MTCCQRPFGLNYAESSSMFSVFINIFRFRLYIENDSLMFNNLGRRIDRIVVESDGSSSGPETYRTWFRDGVLNRIRENWRSFLALGLSKPTPYLKH